MLGKDYPGGLTNHSAVMLDGNLIVFGGSNGRETTNKVWEYNLGEYSTVCLFESQARFTPFSLVRDEWVYRRTAGGYQPSGRMHSAHWSFEGDFHIFGGIAGFTGGAEVDMWSFVNGNFPTNEEILVSLELS